MSKSVLIEADELINGQRQVDYGDAKALFKDLAILQTYYTGHVTKSAECVTFMILLKLMRFRNSGFTHRDSLVDLAGYVGLLERVTED